MEKVDVSLKKAGGFLTLKPHARFEPQQMRLAVVKAGFTPRDITFTAVEGGDGLLKGIDLVVEQNEQQLIFNRQQMRFATTPLLRLSIGISNGTSRAPL